MLYSETHLGSIRREDGSSYSIILQPHDQNHDFSTDPDSNLERFGDIRRLINVPSLKILIPSLINN